MRDATAQAETNERLISALAAAIDRDFRIRDGWLFGAHADPHKNQDVWSDVDCALRAEAAAVADIASPLWARGLGPVWAFDKSGDHDRALIRVIYADGGRLDLIVASDAWRLPQPRVRLHQPPGSRSARCIPAEPDLPQIQTWVNQARFAAAVAVVKHGRNDHLIASHLLLGVLRTVLEQAMRVRDQQTGTVHHRHGGPRNRIAAEVARIAASWDVAGFTPAISQAAMLAEQMETDGNPHHTPDLSGLNALLARL